MINIITIIIIAIILIIIFTIRNYRINQSNFINKKIILKKPYIVLYVDKSYYDSLDEESTINLFTTYDLNHIEILEDNSESLISNLRYFLYEDGCYGNIINDKFLLAKYFELNKYIEINNKICNNK